MENRLLGAFQAAVDEEPDNVYARFQLACLLADEGRHDRALAELDRVNASIPGYEGGAAWLKRGHSLLALSRHGEALASFERVTRLPYTGRCSHAMAVAGKTVALEKLGRKDEAREARIHAEDLAHREGLEWLNDANAAAATGNHSDAISSYDRALAQSWRGRTAALLGRGLSYKALGRFNESLADLAALLQEGGGMPPPEISQAVLADRDDARPIDVVGRLMSTMAEALFLYSRASVRARLGHLQSAAEDIRAALSLGPELRKQARTEVDFAALRKDPSCADLWGT